MRSLLTLSIVVVVLPSSFAADRPRAHNLESYSTAERNLKAGETYSSPDSRCHLTLHEDGNLVLYWHEKPLWSSNTSGVKNPRFALQTDGNLVFYGVKGDGPEKPIWATYTSAKGPTRLACQSDGNLVLYEKQTDSTEKVLWHTGTSAHTPAKFKLKVKRPGNVSGIAADLNLYVNGEHVGKIGNYTEKTFDVTAGRVGQNVIVAKNALKEEIPFPFKDIEGKHAGHRYFKLSGDGEEITLNIGFIYDAPGFVFDVSNEVDREWKYPEIIKVVFDKKRVAEVIQEDPPIRLGTGDKIEFKQTKYVTKRVEVQQKFEVDTSVKAKVMGVVGTGLGEIEGGIQTRWRHHTNTVDEVKLVEEKKITMEGNGKLKHFEVRAIYCTGTTTLFVEGTKVEVPFKVFERYEHYTIDD
ncbi:MAG: hypothetical protein MUF18_01790 [Fimbriiglobus sp.]|nr:hypothetical protein [Fimbriiglobus sp.]